MCSYLTVPAASLDVVVHLNRSVDIVMRQGIYTLNEYRAKSPDQDAYDFPTIFGGTLDDCELTKGRCKWDDALECFTATCATTDVQCPPAGTEMCPGYTYDPCNNDYVCEGQCASRTKFRNCCEDADDYVDGTRYHITQPRCCAGASASSCENTCLLYTSPSPRDRG